MTTNDKLFERPTAATPAPAAPGLQRPPLSLGSTARAAASAVGDATTKVGAAFNIARPSPTAPASAAGAGVSPIQRPTSATSASGRSLGFGERQGSLNVFSDGSSGMPRTVSNSQLQGIGSRVQGVSTSSSPFTRPSVGSAATTSPLTQPSEPLASANSVVNQPKIERPALGSGVAHSMLTGGQTPAFGQIRRPESPMFSRTPVSAERSSQLAAAHDMAAVASRDPTHPLGRAAREAAVQARTGRRGADREAGRAMTGALMSAAGQGVAIGGDMAQNRQNSQTQHQLMATRGTQERELNEQAHKNALEQSQQQAELASQKARERQLVNLANAQVGLLDPASGQVQVATTANGQPVQREVKQPTAPGLSAGQARLMSDLTRSYLGADSDTGMLRDADSGQLRMPSPDEVEAATMRANQTLGRLSGAEAPVARPPQGAIDYLLEHPDQARYFDQKYGEGAAASILGG